MLTLVRNRPPLLLFVFLALAVSETASAQGIDPHRLYEKRCAGCHAAHAGAFGHDSLVERDGKIVGRKSSQWLRSLLDEGHGNLRGEEIDVMLEGGLVQDKRRAAGFLRTSSNRCAEDD